MFLGYQNNKIAFVANTKEELKNLPLVKLDEIVKTNKTYELYNGEYLSEEEIAQKEQERIQGLFLTAADVERAIYRAKGMDFEDIITLVNDLKPQGLDIKALKIELKANNFYRGNPYINAIGSLLGFTPKMLDGFFETNDYTKLIPEEGEE